MATQMQQPLNEATPLDPSLNAAILAIAHDLLPQGWGVSYEAPESFERLKAKWSLYGRFDVFEGGCDDTIYADAGVNHAFRAWHDYRHLTENADFTPEGEATALRAQISDMVNYCCDNSDVSLEDMNKWCDVLHAEIVGQGRYLERHGEFPVNQRAFVEAYLLLGESALAASY